MPERARACSSRTSRPGPSSASPAAATSRSHGRASGRSATWSRSDPSSSRSSRRKGPELVRLAGLDLDDESAASLVERTEGWAAGLYLAALGAAGPSGADRGRRRGFSGDDRVVADYLRHELLAMFPESLVQFLSRTSVLDELSGPLCDAVLESSGSQAMLEELERSNLFVVPLDRTGDQFRYHHLFGDLLRAELRHREPDLQPVLHARASRWYEDARRHRRGSPSRPVRAVTSTARRR